MRLAALAGATRTGASLNLRLLTYNILQGGVGREQEIFEVVNSCHADVIILQELSSSAFLQDLANKLALPHFFFAPANRQLLRFKGSIGFHRRNIGLLSRFPILTAHSYRRFPLRRTLLEATIEYAPGQTLKLYGVHLLASLDLTAELWRGLEINALLRRSKVYQTECCLIAGDFNTIANGDHPLIGNFPLQLKTMIRLQGNRVYTLAIPKLLKNGWLDCYRQLHPTENGFTLPTPQPNTRLDYIFASPALAPALQNCEVVTAPPAVNSASDHYPVIADFQLN